MGRPLHILLSIHHRLDPDSGAPGATIALGEGLRDLGQDVDYLSFDDLPGSLPFIASSLAFPYFAAMKMLREAQSGVDIIDASTGDAWVWGRLGRRAAGPALVTRSHGLEHLFHEGSVALARREGRRLSRRYPIYWGGWRLYEVKASLQAADMVLALNQTERDYLVERLSIEPERIRLAANGVPRWFLEKARVASEAPNRPAIAIVGEHRPMKGVEHGSEALSMALHARPDLHVAFIGAGVPTECVLAHFDQSLRNRVSVVERYRREQLPSLLIDRSIVFFPSHSEGFSLALLEAMACGLAPVASDISAVRRVVANERSGLLTAPTDAPAAAAALLRLLDDPALLTRLRAGARGAASSYSWEAVSQKTLVFYGEALELRANRPRMSSA